MEHTKSNFIYLKGTHLEKYYNELIKAEYLCEYYPIITKIIVRKVFEMILKEIANKNNINTKVSAIELLNKIKSNCNVCIEEQFFRNTELILTCGYEELIQTNSIKIRHPIEILKIAQKSLYLYLKSEIIKFNEKNLYFNAPTTIEYMEKELIKVSEDIKLKENLIDNLRQKVLETNNNVKKIGSINNLIILIKKEKNYLEEIRNLLNEKINIQNKYLLEIKNSYKLYQIKFEKLKENFIQYQKDILEKENEILNCEIKRHEIKNLSLQLYEEDEAIKEIELLIEKNLKEIRLSYKQILNLEKEIEDIWKTREFSYDKLWQEELKIRENNIQIQINFENKIFNERLSKYGKNISEVRKKMIIFKELLNENIKGEVKYKKFYNGFLNLEEKEIKILYTIMENNTFDSILESKSRDILWLFNEDKFLEKLNKNLEKFKNINNNEIKLILYYQMIKLEKEHLGDIYNRKKFVKVLDYIVEKSYENLMINKNFMGEIGKLEAINRYCLEKIILALKGRGNNIQLSDELINKIYKITINSEENFKLIRKKIYINKFKLHEINDVSVTNLIKSHPIDFLASIVEVLDIKLYKQFYIILFEIINIINKRDNKKFSVPYLMINLYIEHSNISINRKYQGGILPLIITLITCSNEFKESNISDVQAYNQLFDVWKNKQRKYSDIYIKKIQEKNRLDILIKERYELENNKKDLQNKYEFLINRYKSYKKEFENIVMSSEKRILLPSYFYYYDLLNKNKNSEKHISDSKNKSGTFRSLFSIDMWKEKASKAINESNLVEAEKLLIKEAMEKQYFKNEASIFFELENNIKETDELIIKVIEDIKNKTFLIEESMKNISELEKQMKIIKDIYLDMKEKIY